MDTWMWVGLYFFVGFCVGGTGHAILTREDNGIPPEMAFFGIILWPLLIPITLGLGISKLAYKLLYGKQDRINNVTNKLKGKGYELPY